METASLPFEKTTYRLSYRKRLTGSHCLVCLHGLQSNKSLFSPFFEDPDFLSYSIVAPDFLGFGDSDKPEAAPYTLEMQVCLIENLIRSLDIKNFHIIGHSLGGMVGTLLTRSAPLEVLSLSSLEGNLALEDCGTSREISTLAQQTFREAVYPKIKADLENSKAPSAKFRYESLISIPDFVFLRTAKSIVSTSQSGEVLRAFLEASVPRLLVLGSQGSFSSRPHGSDIQIKEIENAGHFMLLDRPKETRQALSRFLENATP